VPVQHVIPGSHQDFYKWERKYLEFSEVDIKKLNVGSYKDMDLARSIVPVFFLGKNMSLSEEDYYSR
jgi:hypothetical protein